MACVVESSVSNTISAESKSSNSTPFLPMETYGTKTIMLERASADSNDVINVLIANKIAGENRRVKLGAQQPPHLYQY